MKFSEQRWHCDLFVALGKIYHGSNSRLITIFVLPTASENILRAIGDNGLRIFYS